MNGTESRLHLVDSKSLQKVLLVSFCLVAATFSADRLAPAYLDRVHQIGTWNLAIHYSDTVAAAFLVLQMVVAAVVFKVGRHRLSADVLRRLLWPNSIKPVVWGLLVGLVITVAALPLLFLFDEHAQFVRLILDNPISLQTVLLVCLIGVSVPFVTEVVFRGIIFDVLARSTNPLFALIGSSLLFAYVWNVFDGGVALLLGVACGLLYQRSNSLVPSVIASGVVTILASLILFFRLLFKT